MKQGKTEEKAKVRLGETRKRNFLSYTSHMSTFHFFSGHMKKYCITCGMEKIFTLRRKENGEILENRGEKRHFLSRERWLSVRDSLTRSQWSEATG